MAEEKVIIVKNDDDILKNFKTGGNGTANSIEVSKSISNGNNDMPKPITTLAKNNTSGGNKVKVKSNSSTPKPITSLTKKNNTGGDKVKMKSNSDMPVPITRLSQNSKSQVTSKNTTPTNKGNRIKKNANTNSNANESLASASGFFRPANTSARQLPSISSNVQNIPIGGISGSQLTGTGIGNRIADFFRALFEVLILRGVLFYLLMIASVIYVAIYIYQHRAQIISTIITWLIFIIIGIVIVNYFRRGPRR